jgi:hypothetical protein
MDNTIDLKISPVGATLSYDATSGLLQITDSAEAKATLSFQTSSLGSGSFHLASAGPNDLALTLR